MRDYVEEILSAANPGALFGADATESDVHSKWRRLSRLVHPDVNSDPRAEDAFKRLNDLADEGKRQLRAGAYGSSMWSVLTRKGARYEFQENPAWQGDSCDVFLGERLVTGGREPVWVKVARNPADNDLLANEAKAIKRVLAGKAAVEKYAHLYAAPLADGFQVTLKGARHRANVFNVRPDDTITMRDLKRLYPDGVDPRDAAWMFRRLTWGLALAHDAGVVHGAVLPQHLLLTPEAHGVTLLDWRAASIDSAPITVLSSGMRDFYPKQLLAKEKARSEYDLAMAAACMVWVCGGWDKLPRPLRGFYKGCRAGVLPSAWELRQEYTQLIEAMWGPRKFRPFVVPGMSRGEAHGT